MPTISLFYGISIRLFYNDHAPPHFHAVYGELVELDRRLRFRSPFCKACRLAAFDLWSWNGRRPSGRVDGELEPMSAWNAAAAHCPPRLIRESFMSNIIVAAIPGPDASLVVRYQDEAEVKVDFTAVIEQGGMFKALADPGCLQAGRDRRSRPLPRMARRPRFLCRRPSPPGHPPTPGGDQTGSFPHLISAPAGAIAVNRDARQHQGWDWRWFQGCHYRPAGAGPSGHHGRDAAQGGAPPATAARALVITPLEGDEAAAHKVQEFESVRRVTRVHRETLKKLAE